MFGLSPELIVSRANLSRNGPRSGLSKDDSSMVTFSEVLFAREFEGDGDGNRFLSGDGDRRLLVDPFWIAGMRMFSGVVFGGVLTEIRLGIFVVSVTVRK